MNYIYLSQLHTTNFEINLKNYNNSPMVFQIYFIFCKCPNTFVALEGINIGRDNETITKRFRQQNAKFIVRN